MNAWRSMSKKPFTIRLKPDLVERMRNIVYWTPSLTLNELAEQSLEVCVKTLEEEKGGFPAREGDVKKGKRV